MYDTTRPLAVSPTEAAAMIGIGRTSLYREIARGELTPLKADARTLLRVADLEAWLDRRKQGQLAPAQLGYPVALAKACDDQWRYTLRLTTGETVVFSRADAHGPFVHIWFDTGDSEQGIYPQPDPRVELGRGMDVQVAQIVWCIDADS